MGNERWLSIRDDNEGFECPFCGYVTHDAIYETEVAEHKIYGKYTINRMRTPKYCGGCGKELDGYTLHSKYTKNPDQEAVIRHLAVPIANLSKLAETLDKRLCRLEEMATVFNYVPDNDVVFIPMEAKDDKR